MNPIDVGHPEPNRSRRRHRIAAAAVAVPVVAASLAAAAWVNRPEPATEFATVNCYRQAVPDAESAGADLVNSSGPVDPMEECRGLWREGGWSPEEGSPVPPLVPCVGAPGVLTVVPGRGPAACDAAGLAPLSHPSRYFQEDHQAQTAADGLFEQWANRCVPVDQAIVDAEQALSDVGLDGWSVDVADTKGPAGPGPCASVYDLSDRTLTIITGPQPAG